MTNLIITDQPAREVGEHINSIIQDHYGDAVVLLGGDEALDIVEHIKPGKKCFHQECQSDATQTKETFCQRSECRTIFIMGDEQVSRGSKTGNYLQLLQRYADHPVVSLTIDTNLNNDESVKDFSTRIENTFLEKLTELNNPKIISILNIYYDGHVAGIFSMDEASFRKTYQDDQTYVSIQTEGLKIDSRASFTPSWILNNADELIGYAVGLDKKDILVSMSLETKKLNERPAELFSLHKHSSIYTDQDIEAK